VRRTTNAPLQNDPSDKRASCVRRRDFRLFDYCTREKNRLLNTCFLQRMLTSLFLNVVLNFSRFTLYIIKIEIKIEFDQSKFTELNINFLSLDWLISISISISSPESHKFLI